MEERKRMDLDPHEAFDVLEDIKRNTFHSLAEMRRENLNGKVIVIKPGVSGVGTVSEEANPL